MYTYGILDIYLYSLKGGLFLKISDMNFTNLKDEYLEKLQKDKPFVISNMNFKGGASKTVSTALQSYELSRNGFKILTIDNDPQANLTEFLLQDKEFDLDISDVLLNDKNIEDCITTVNEYLDILPSSLNYVYIDEVDKSRFNINKLKFQIDRIKHKYDFIFIDVPPSININLKLAIHCCTHINLVVQTKMPSFSGSKKLIQWLEYYLGENNIDVNLIGALPTLTHQIKEKHKNVLEVIRDEYGSITYDNYIDYSDRIDTFNDFGITEGDYWSERTLYRFNQINNEMIEKILSFND